MTESKKFKVGMECGYAPFNWTQSDNSNGAVAIEGGGFAGGYDVEVAKKIAAKLGKELVIVKTEWDGLEPALQSGVIDAIIAGMSPTADRKTRIEFSDNYYKSDLVVVVKKDGKFANAKTLKDFTDAKITAQLNTFHYTVIEQLTGAKKETAMPDFPTMITALSSGAIDGYISERPGAVSAMASNSNLAFISFAEGSGFVASEEDVAVAIGLKKGSDKKTAINEVLAEMSTADRQTLMDNAVKNQPVSN
jgi:ABC-type amino acid transport substrate-binding protein